MAHGRVKIAAAVIECIGIAVASVGIGLELACGGPAHLVTITVGSVLVATGALLWAKVAK